METFNTLDELLMKRYQAEYDNMRKSLPSLFNRLRYGGNHLFDNVYWSVHSSLPYPKYELSGEGTIINVNSTIIYQHQCGSKDGRYRISKKGTCYKCKKMIGSYKQLDTIRGLKALTEKESNASLPPPGNDCHFGNK